MTPEKETELFNTLGHIVGMLQSHGERLAKIEGRLDGIDKRLDDQGRMIAAMIPTHLAAIPPQKPAA